MALKAEGIWGCTVLSASSGADDKGLINVQINVRIDDGPNAGQHCTYEDAVNNKSAPYVARSCRAVGWTGTDITTLKSDCAKWITDTGGKSTVEIKHIEIRKGKRAGEIWDKPNSIGRGPRVLKEPTRNDLADANEVLAAALNGDGGGGGDYDEAPPPGDDDRIPFASCSREPSTIARVLRGAL
jgi:hypothetical protein